MRRLLTPIDISKMPDLLDLVEEVEATRKPRELRRDNKSVALLTPITENKEKWKKLRRSLEAGMMLTQTNSLRISTAGERKDHGQPHDHNAIPS
jgi:hypothetical protein